MDIANKSLFMDEIAWKWKSDGEGHKTNIEGQRGVYVDLSYGLFFVMLIVFSYTFLYLFCNWPINLFQIKQLLTLHEKG